MEISAAATAVKVCVTVDGELYSVKPETTEEFFQKEILGRLNA